ncbi:MAG: hypothetical protein DME99_01085 [Verrucomicrobia bacterium]|nr:MAG: hypothetical protein DME99_01085 [Verrucomicrobiota bacterium]
MALPAALPLISRNDAKTHRTLKALHAKCVGAQRTFSERGEENDVCNLVFGLRYLRLLLIALIE